MHSDLVQQFDDFRAKVAEIEAARASVPSDVVLLIDAERLVPTLGSLGRHRWNWFHRESNGIDSCGAMFKRGGRVYLHIPKYVAWLTGVDNDLL